MTPIQRILLSAALFQGLLPGASAQPAYQPTWESLKAYEVPAWFRDAKFGIFIHWGAYSVPAFGSEWYPREMYVQGSEVFRHHVATYGPQSKFGYKDLIARFRAEHWDPDEWADLFLASGAKYVIPVAEHHDGFPMYDCSLTRWNAARMGPKRDVIGELAAAVRRRGLIFGVSSHRAEHWFFMNPGRSFDSDVRDTAFADLYGPARPDTVQPDSAYLADWYARCSELAQKYHPSLFYFDWWIEQPAFAPWHRRFAAQYYNASRGWSDGVVINYKNSAFPDHTAVLDIERGRLQEGRALPWQTDTSIGRKSWGYVEGEDIRPASEIVPILADIVSKNGCLLLNIGPKSDGTITPGQQNVLRDIGAWLRVNGEAIYGTRPWVVAEEGVTRQQSGGMFSENRERPYTAEDIRFTSHGEYVYAIVLGWPGRSCTIRSLRPEPGSEISMLGYGTPLRWTWDGSTGLHVEIPAELQQEGRRPCLYAYTLKARGTHAPVLARPSIRIGGTAAGERFIFADSVSVELHSENADASILYTLDGSVPTEKSPRYTRPFTVSRPVTVRAVASCAGYVESMPSVTRLGQSDAIRSFTFARPYSRRFNGDGDLTLADGMTGSTDLNDGRWLGFEGSDAEFVVELKTSRAIRAVRIGCLEDQNSWLFFPRAVDASVSPDGTTYGESVHADCQAAAPSNTASRREFTVPLASGNARFIKIRVSGVGVCPSWHKGAGGKAWLFLDEVTVE